MDQFEYTAPDDELWIMIPKDNGHVEVHAFGKVWDCIVLYTHLRVIKRGLGISSFSPPDWILRKLIAVAGEGNPDEVER